MWAHGMKFRLFQVIAPLNAIVTLSANETVPEIRDTDNLRPSCCNDDHDSDGREDGLLSGITFISRQSSSLEG